MVNKLKVVRKFGNKDKGQLGEMFDEQVNEREYQVEKVFKTEFPNITYLPTEGKWFPVDAYVGYHELLPLEIKGSHELEEEYMDEHPNGYNVFSDKFTRMNEHMNETNDFSLIFVFHFQDFERVYFKNFTKKEVEDVANGPRFTTIPYDKWEVIEVDYEEQECHRHTVEAYFYEAYAIKKLGLNRTSAKVVEEEITKSFNKALT